MVTTVGGFLEETEGMAKIVYVDEARFPEISGMAKSYGVKMVHTNEDQLKVIRNLSGHSMCLVSD